MSKHLIRQDLESMDLAALGLITGAHADMMMLGTLGQMIPAHRETFVLLRRELDPEGAWAVVGEVDSDQAELGNSAGWPTAANMGYQFCVARLGADGNVSVWSEPMRRDFDGSNVEITPRLPVAPKSVWVEPALGGAFTIGWRYESFGEGAAPDSFQLFRGASAALDYGTPLTDAATALTHVVTDGRSVYEVTTTNAWVDGTLNWFGVRGRNSNGVAEKNANVAGPYRALAAAPAAPTPMNLRQARA